MGINRKLRLLGYWFKRPQDILAHLKLKYLYYTARHKRTVIRNINTLTLGHPVTKDKYFLDRVDFIKKTLVVPPSSGPIQVRNNIIINGNGRIAALRESGLYDTTVTVEELY